MPLLSNHRETTQLSPPLPIGNKVLNSAGITLRRGQFSLLAAGPGVGKTLFATNLALFTKEPALYYSADSDEWTVRTRAIAILTGQRLDVIEKQLNEPNWNDYYLQVLGQADHVDWCYRTDIDVEFIVRRLKSFTEIRGYYPKLVVVDNLGNTVAGGGDEYAELRGVCRDLQDLARSTRSHVMGLHHVKGAKESGFQPIGLGDLLGNLGKSPEQVFGLHRVGNEMLGLTVPKNRVGKSGMELNLPIDYPSATVGGWR